MTKKPERPTDTNELAKLIADISTGGKLNDSFKKPVWTKLKKPLNKLVIVL